ncbi:MAG: pyridoxal-5'-phosphate-dependent protein subunit beta [Deltaproteobacteria bacterium]|nr:pyridoxal-5'-phosphate-dependent protein subunit beta [Deltaproteobacteria bacterium]MBW2255490.1 pyridoxal-5'-phosphate-dependent protein subunit beta [Deltaproteobacteria bacterium]
MARLGLESEITDPAALARTVGRFAEAGIVMPTLAQLADPATIPAGIWEALAEVDPDAPHPLNLFRVHWYNDSSRRGYTKVPGYLVLPSELTGVPAKIVLALGSRFPMIATHKVLAAFGCLVPRLVTGQFDPTQHKAVWPSTGNYCRGGVAISRILRCHGVAVLPEGMSQERFDWLDDWVVDASDVYRTPGSESNVKEIYDKCAVLDREPDNIIFNQFNEFGNHLVHYICTGRALEDVFEDMGGEAAGLRLSAFVSATGSGGTIAAGDYLKEAYGSRTVAVEALECPTLLYNGFGEHNIQGIGDKHVPLIHNIGTNDAVTAISETVTDTLNVLFNTEIGRQYLVERRGLDPDLVGQLGELGLSSICNVLAAIKTARYYNLGSDDVVMTVATDSAELYDTELEMALDKYFGGRFDIVSAGETYGWALLGTTVDHFLELNEVDRRRLFNLGYFTWVEQQGVSIEEFEARWDQSYWRGLRTYLDTWDRLIESFNAAVAAVP